MWVKEESIAINQTMHEILSHNIKVISHPLIKGTVSLYSSKMEFPASFLNA